MLLTSVIIVLREVLEAALLVSILLALSNVLGLSRRWVGWSLGAGMAGACIYSLGVAAISDWFDGVGQEVTSAALQFLVYLLLLLITLLLLRASSARRLPEKLTMLIMAATVSLAITREGFEVLVYIYGFSSDLPRFATILMGSAIGASIGISIGALIYYFVSSLSYRQSLVLGIGLLALVAAGMLSQAVLLLIQADWLPSQLPIWDSSEWLSEESVTGQLMYALIGYEATPTALQASFYFGGLLLLLIVAVLAVRSRREFV
jgi:high-affinity iron transporter